MQNVLTAKANIDQILGDDLSKKEKEKSQEER